MGDTRIGVLVSDGNIGGGYGWARGGHIVPMMLATVLAALISGAMGLAFRGLYLGFVLVRGTGKSHRVV
jgi:hypothetical protein